MPGQKWNHLAWVYPFMVRRQGFAGETRPVRMRHYWYLWGREKSEKFFKTRADLLDIPRSTRYNMNVGRGTDDRTTCCSSAW